jgi:hypothetical protein
MGKANKTVLKLSFGMLSHIVWLKFTDVSDKHAVTTFREEENSPTMKTEAVHSSAFRIENEEWSSILRWQQHIHPRVRKTLLDYRVSYPRRQHSSVTAARSSNLTRYRESY